MLGAHSISCKCETVYTGHYIEIGVKEYHPDKSDVAKHSINLDHCNQLQAPTSILAKKSRYRDGIIREATETELQPNNMNREDGFSLHRSWKPVIPTLKAHTSTQPFSACGPYKDLP
jgi:hypothetical protein